MDYGALNLIICGSWYMALTSTEAFIQDQGTFVMSLMALLFTNQSEAMICDMTTLFVGLINNIASIIAQHDCNNDASNDDILKVLPHNLCVLQTFPLCISIHWHRLWLEIGGWNIQSIEDIENDHWAMVQAYHKEMTFKNVVDKCSNLWIKFHIEWIHCNGPFLQLQNFCSNLASNFLI